ncbi:MAG: Mpo1-like protein, partial [Alphaproteobacteria bacterium]
KNKPATVSDPLWSLRGDFHMLWLWLSGQLEIELQKYKI